MAKEKDLVEQARNTGARMRARAAPLMDRGFLTEPAAASQRVRTQPGDAQQVNDAQKNMQNGSPSAQPTRFASGGRVGGKCMKCGGSAHKGMCAGGKMAKGGKAKHDDAAADTKLFKKLYAAEEKKEPKELAKGGKMNWIAGAVKKPGALHRELGVPEGKKIPKSKIDAAANSSNPMLAKRANFAKTVSKFAAGGSANLEADEPAAMQRNKIVPGAAGAGHGETGTLVPRNKVTKYAHGGVAKIRHGEMTKDQKQTPNKPSGWNAYK